MRRAADRALWLLPPLLSLALYWQGLWCELQQDDFAWLGLRLEIHGPSDLLRVLFEPRAQGTGRPISERLYFLVFSELFGLWALPYRLTAFAFQTANLLLLNAVTRRLTGSAAAGCMAAIGWAASSSTAVPMSWSAAFNQILCGFCILSAFLFLLRYVETGQARDWKLQWVFYLFGFGALELNIVYPALASAYAALVAPKLLRKTLPMWAPALAYFALHRWFASAVPAGPYTVHFGVSMLDVLFDYWQRALGPAQLGLVRPVPSWFGLAGTALLTVALLGFAGVQARRGRRQGLFMLAWFLIAIAPYLPLRDQRMHYYPFLAAAGLAMLGGWALRQSSERGRASGVAAAALALLYLGSSTPVGRAQMFYHYVRGQRVKPLVEGVVQAHRLDPDKTILLDGIDEPLFWGGVNDEPFRLFKVYDVFLVPETSESGTERYRNQRPRFELSAVEIRSRVRSESAIVLRLEGLQLQDVTADWWREEP